MADDLLAHLLATLGRPARMGFNLFDVMRHGTHEKQISNVFGWLLDVGGSHRLDDRFQRIFIDEVSRALPAGAPDLPTGPYLVHQEVNTSEPDAAADIADLVLTSDSAALVIENYVTSDGHGHDYHRYLAYGRSQASTCQVVLLSRYVDPGLMTDGWENAASVSYAALVGRLHAELAGDRRYQVRNPDAYWFISQLHDRFAEERSRMDDLELLDFITAMCATGQSARYGERPAPAADQFAADIADLARQQFCAGRDVLQRLKARLRGFAATTLRSQLDEAFGEGFVRSVSTRYSGRYQWTVNIDVDDVVGGDGGVEGEAALQLKFGPSARFANEDDPEWTTRVPPAEADYGRVFITRARRRELRQSSVALREVLDGLAPTDRRLADEIIALFAPTAEAAGATAERGGS